MSQWIQKPGGGKIDLSTTKYKTLQDAANAGYSPVSAPPAPTPPTPPPTSISTPTPTPTTQQTGIVQHPNAPIGWGLDPVTKKLVKIT